MKLKPNAPLIIKLRKERGLTQTQVANELGIVRNAYTYLELGQRLMSISEAMKLAALLQTGTHHITAKAEPTSYDDVYALPMVQRIYYSKSG